MPEHRQRLKRLPPEHYRSEAWVHWTLAIEGRKTGWLDPKLLYKFREIQTHVAFRAQIACPIFCLMPDHLHLLWCGLTDESDQLLGMKHLRTDLNDCLNRIGYQLQLQSFDHVLKNHELERDAIESVVDYIARNPERQELVPIDGFSSYKYTGCLMPGYPQLRLFQDEGWDRIWRTLAFLKRTQCFRVPDPKYPRKP
ncbi:hypothetical protein [Rhodopirellula sallentina]|uniref:Transposase IS200-like domain-containing protein n=1 Tax=Rhodopirellula sallentina SM41 TaxID=1263870 RepID=M5UK91_9BACT|nr:hypothetical protein [Rhodopirellula sallentina]EMI56443.1 hypothetical protein RSSM_02092 [Rhodopirellula sallentina SM41]